MPCLYHKQWREISMGFHKSLTSSIKILTIFCFAYIHTSLHAKTKNINETQIVELVDVIYKDGKKADERVAGSLK